MRYGSVGLQIWEYRLGSGRIVGTMESEGAAALVADLLNGTREIASGTLTALLVFGAFQKLASEWERRAIGAVADAVGDVVDAAEDGR